MKIKKTLALSALMFAAVSAFAADEKPKAALNDFKDFTHWSISVNAAMSQFDGDAKQEYNQLLSNSHVSWGIGLDLEYTFNPYWGIIAQFEYLPYQGRTSSANYGVNDFHGHMYDPSLQVSLNLFNIFGQYRSTWRWAMYLNAGIGMTFYSVESESVEAGPKTPAGFTDGRCINFPVYLNVEYNINNYMAVGLLAGYRFHNKDNFEGEDYTRGTMNDGAWTIGANFRVKLVPNKKSGHMRNLSPFEYRMLKTGESSLAGELDSLSKRLTALEDTVYNNVLPRLDELTATTPDADGDGVPDIRDREPNSPAGSFVNYWGETISDDDVAGKGCCEDVKEIKEYIDGQTLGVDEELAAVYKFNSSELTTSAKNNIGQIAKRLKKDSKLKVEIIGYTDFPGSDEYNKQLSQQRAEAAKKEFVAQGIDESRIKVTAKGKITEPATYASKNRRCDFNLYRD